MNAEAFFVAAPRGIPVPFVVFHAHGLLAQHGGQGSHGLAQLVVGHGGIVVLELAACGVVEESGELAAQCGVERLLPIAGSLNVGLAHFDLLEQPLRGSRACLPAHHCIVLVVGAGGMERLVLVLIIDGGKPIHRVAARNRRA